jgi:hypothetical protein
MAHPEIEKLIKDLQTWCKAKHGRNLEVAKMLDVSPQLVSDWFSHKTVPTTEHFLRLRDFLKKNKPKRRRKVSKAPPDRDLPEDLDLDFP